MAEDSALLRDDLLARIEARRSDVRAYLRENRPRLRRRANLTIVLSTLAALFTAGPAVGGETFSRSVQQNLGLSSDSLVWRVLCLAALVVSLAAAVLTNLGKSEDAANRLSTAEAANAELEGLTTLLQFGQLPVEEAGQLYQQYVVKIPFIQDMPAPTAGPAGTR